MRSVFLTGIRQMEVREVDTPVLQGDHDVLVRMVSLGVCGSDVHYYEWGRIGRKSVQYPFVVGHEGAGIVEQVGSEVTRVRAGDHVAIEPAMSCRQLIYLASRRKSAVNSR